MALKKSDIRVLVEITRGSANRIDLSKKLKVSPNYLSPILRRLARLEFIYLEKKGKKLSINLSDTQFALSFKSILIQDPGTDYAGFLYGLNHKILSYCLFSSKTYSDIALQLHISKKTVMNQSLRLRNRQLLVKENDSLVFNKQSWPALYKFLSDFRNFSGIGNILWKFEDEIFFESQSFMDATITGFSAYSSFGIPVNVIRQSYYLPKRKLSKEEIFIHSLLQIRDTRLLELAVAFYYNNNPSGSVLSKQSAKYDCSDKLNDFYKVLQLKEGQIKMSTLPLASAKGIKEMLEIYKVRKNGR